MDQLHGAHEYGRPAKTLRPKPGTSRRTGGTSNAMKNTPDAVGDKGQRHAGTSGLREDARQLEQPGPNASVPAEGEGDKEGDSF